MSHKLTERQVAVMSPREKVAEQTVGPVNYDSLRSVIHSATHAALPFAEAPMTVPFSTQERAALQAEIADLVISNLDKAAAPTAALASSGDHAGLKRLADEAADFGVPAKVDPAVLNALIAEVAALRGERDAMTDNYDRATRLHASTCRDLTEAERKLAEAVGLLKPFSEAAENLEDETRDHDDIWEQPAAMSIDAGDLRAARTFLASMEPKT